MHVLDKILAEGYEEQNSEHAAEERAEEYLDEIHGDFGVGGLENIEGRKGEDGTCHNHTRAGTYALYDYVLANGILLA